MYAPSVFLVALSYLALIAFAQETGTGHGRHLARG